MLRPQREIKRARHLIVLALFTVRLWAATPDWVRLAASQPSSKYEPDTNAVVLLDSTEDTVSGPGEYVEHYRRVVRILRPEGRTEGNLAVYLGHQEKLLSVHAWTIDPSGHDYDVKDKDFLERNPYSEELYSDFHFRTATAPAALPGSVIGLEYEVRRHGLLNQLDWIFQELLPVREAQFTVHLPPGWEYKSAWAAAKPVAPDTIANGWQWTIKDVPAIEPEPRMPSFRSLVGHMEVIYSAPGANTVGSWDALGRWYANLTAGRRASTVGIAAKVNQLTAGKTDFDGKARALASFLQAEVRYVAIEIGIGGFQPHAASDIFRARYGDCKDKATLLSSMLRDAGISSDYVVISTYRGAVDPAVPSAESFNHVILAIELPPSVNSESYRSVITGKTGQRYLIFDPTDEYTPLGELRGQLQDSYALLVTDSGGELIHIPLLPAEDNLLSHSGHFTLAPDGTLSGDVTETRSGDHASHERALVMQLSHLERLHHLERELNQSLKGFTLESSDIQELDQLQKNLVLTLKLVAPQYGVLRGTMMLVRPRVLEEKSFEVENKPRHYAFLLGSTSHEIDSYEINLPPGYTVEDVPDPVKIDVGFASYQSKTEITGAKLRYWREYVVRDLRVSADHIAELRQLEGTIGADENAIVILKRVQ